MPTTDKNQTRDPSESAIAKVIEYSVNNQLLIIVMMIALLVAGILAACILWVGPLSRAGSSSVRHLT